MQTIRSILVAACVLHLSATALADVLVVDAGGGGDFTAIQPAVDAASTGDSLLVKPGSYGSFTVDAEGLSVMGDGPGVLVSGSITVRSTSGAQPVVLARLDATGFKDDDFVDYPALVIDVASGPVRVEACRLTGADADSPCKFFCPPEEKTGGVAVRVDAGLDVSFVRCTITGGRGEESVTNGGPDSAGGAGVRAVGSALSFHDCEVRGGHGAEPPPIQELEEGGDGGDAIVAMDTALLDAIVVVSGSVVAGGEGGDGDECFCVSGDGGDGLKLIGAGARAYLLDSVLSGGRAGCAQFQPTVPGQPLVELGGASTTSWPGEARSFAMPGPVREGEVVTLRFRGVPRDTAILAFSSVADFAVVPAASGVQLLDAPVSQHVMGVVPASGLLEVTLVMPTVPGAAEGSLRFLQASFIDPSNGHWLASPSSLVVLDDAF